MQGAAAKVAVFSLKLQVAADDGADLRGIEAKVNARGAEADSFHLRGER